MDHVISATRRASRRYAIVQSILLCAFALMFFLMPGRPVLPEAPFRTLGTVLCAAGLILMFAALASIRTAVQIAPEPRAGARLVTTGVYQWLRHPIYTGILILVAGLCFRRPTVVIAAAAVTVIAFLLFKARFEERLLLGRYAEYTQYSRRTWGVVPGIR